MELQVRQLRSERLCAGSARFWWTRVLPVWLPWCTLASFCMGIVACRTAPVPDFTIPVPPGAEVAQVEVAIISAVTGRSAPPHLRDSVDLKAALPDSEVEHLFGTAYPESRHGSVLWALEDRRSGESHVGISWGQYYVHLLLEFDSTSVRPKVLRSEYLNQYGGRIHKNAIYQIDQFIRIVERNVYNTRVGVDPPSRTADQ